MEKKNYLILDDEFLEYCKINNIEDIEKKAKEVFKQGFDILKYGLLSTSIDKETLKKYEELKAIDTTVIEVKEIKKEKIIEINNIYDE
jgi:hypothetical protein